MWKANLNRHFRKTLPALRVPCFLILWNAIFHAFTLSILLFWTLTSRSIPVLQRMSTLNQFLSENQMLFAALASCSALFFFKPPVQEAWSERRIGFQRFLRGFLRGLGFGSAAVIALSLKGEFSFLGLSAQLNLNFLAAYTWIFRSILILALVISAEFLVRVVVRGELRNLPGRNTIEILTLVLIYWAWFAPGLPELLTLVLAFSVFPDFWSSSGFVSAFFALIHAVCGLDFFENQGAGILQFKPADSALPILENPYLQAMLFLLIASSRYVSMRNRKEIRSS
jgi:hypothetical protein